MYTKYNNTFFIFQVLKVILELLPVAPAVRSFVVDFESGLWRALQSVFNDPQIHGCAFHWGQAVWRKVQEFGLQVCFLRKNS